MLRLTQSRGGAMSDPDKALSMLYPFLGKSADSTASDQALVASVSAKAQESVLANQEFFSRSAARLVSTAAAVADVYRAGGRMFAMGNGGSACDAAHFAVEFQHPITVGRPALPVTNLCADAALITALGNDVGIGQIFARQIAGQARAGDGLIGFSTSGNSENLLGAFAKAHEMGLITMAMTGGDGGAVARSDSVEHCLCVESDSVHRVQEIQLTAYHILWDLVHSLLASAKADAS